MTQLPDLKKQPTSSIATTNQDLAKSPDTTPNAMPMKDSDSTTEIYRPIKTTVLYSSLLDESPIKNSPSINPSSEASTNHIHHNDTVLTPLTKPINHSNLHKTHKSEILTDTHILVQSKQLLPTDDALVDDSTTTGTMVEHLGVATRQWRFTANWQCSNVPKAGLINKLRRRTEILDLDLSCLLCNRYGEVIERVWFKNVRDQAESVRHYGDELLGTPPALPDNIESTGDNPDAMTGYTNDGHTREYNQEHISLYLPRIPPSIFHVVMLISSYQGRPLIEANEGVCQLTDDEGNIICEANLSTLPNTCTTLWLATLTRSGDSWRFNNDNTCLTGYQLKDLEKQVANHLTRTAK